MEACHGGRRQGPWLTVTNRSPAAWTPWKPDLDYVDLNEGETSEGWLAFDVPAKHGQVVLGQSFGGGVVGTWSF
jgi:fermentation-respiration switch protein FrsA (DUF1100 family)